MRNLPIVILLIWVVFPSVSCAQDLLDLFVRERFRAATTMYFEENGLAVEILPLAHIPTRSDTLRQWLDQLQNKDEEENDDLASIQIREWDLISKLERAWFRKKYRNTLWAFLGSESLMPVDTTFTYELRAQFEAYFGPPTQTITELEARNERSMFRDRNIQFEYWFIVNDSIPLILMDVNGPRERGIITATDYRFREIILPLRESFLEELLQIGDYAPYIDYYFDPFEERWHETGFNGKRYFTNPIPKPNFALGRPWVSWREIMN